MPRSPSSADEASPGDLAVRRALDDDIGAAIAVASAALGWRADEPNEAFFRWKHLENPAGRSPMWLATDGERVAGFRTMMHWRFVGADGTEHRAVRAVDTATHPDFQRRGVFRSLTTAAVDTLTNDGVGFVFNTPNDNSRPGYLRMGWREVGRLPTRVSIGGLGSLTRVARARTAADKWSEPCAAGEPIHGVAADLAELARSAPGTGALTTVRTAKHLAWRYGFEPLQYRVISTDDAAAVVRVRRRGPAREVVLAEVFSPTAAATRVLMRAIRKAVGGDHILTLDRAPHPSPWLPKLPLLGPRLTVRDLAEPGPNLDQFRFALGDIELF